MYVLCHARYMFCVVPEECVDVDRYNLLPEFLCIPRSVTQPLKQSLHFYRPQILEALPPFALHGLHCCELSHTKAIFALSVPNWQQSF